MSLSNKIASNTIIQIASKVIATILGLVTIGILTRELGQDGFGQYTIIMTFLSFFAIAGDLGLTLVTSQMLSEKEINQTKILNNLFSFRFISALIFLGLAPIIVIFFPYNSDIKIGVAIASISFLFIALNQIFVGFFQYKLKMDRVSIADIVSKIVLVICIIYITYYHGGLIKIIIAIVIANAVSFWLHFWFTRKFVKVRFAFNREIWQKIIKKSWPIAITIGLNLIYLKGDLLVLSFVKSSKDVGLYGAAYKVIDVLTMIPFVFSGIILPILTSSWINDQKEFNQLMQKSADLMIILAIPLVVGAQFIGTGIMRTVAGYEFIESGVILQILIIACAFIFFGTLFSHAIIAINKQKTMIMAYIFVSVTSVIGYVIFIPKFSYIGAAWMTVYSETVIAIFSFYYVKKYTNFSLNLNVLFKTIVATIVMGVFLYVTKSYCSTKIGLIIIFMLASIIYIAFMFLLKGITKEDIKSLL